MDYWLDLGHCKKNSFTSTYKERRPENALQTSSFIVVQETESEAQFPDYSASNHLSVDSVKLSNSLDGDQRGQINHLDVQDVQDVFS